MSTRDEGGMLGLVELVDADSLIDIHGAGPFKAMHETFITRLKDWVRARDEWHMMGNNRICVVLKGVKDTGSLQLATAKLARLFDEPHQQFGRTVPLEISAGFTRLENPERGIDAAIREAGLALMQAKRDSRLYDVYAPQRMQAAGDEQELAARLEKALELDELQLFYQPKVHAGYHSLIGAEALLRWHTRDGEVISPGRFIPVAENHPVIRPLTWWVIKSAVARLARWPEQLSIAVNIPPNLLLDDQIHAVVDDALKIYGVQPSRLTLEVTERVMVGDQGVMLEQLRSLWKLGIKISLDDFGTGFSSFAYFRELPVDELKIDQCFVRPMLESGKDHAIVKSLIELAHNFSLRVVAEGVETLDIAKRLGELGCDILQGYVFDRPLPVEEFEAGYGIGGEPGSTDQGDTAAKNQLN